MICMDSLVIMLVLQLTLTVGPSAATAITEHAADESEWYINDVRVFHVGKAEILSKRGTR